MRKFTKEISALLASVAVGAAACATASASSEQMEQTAGVMAISDEIAEDTPTAGVPLPPDEPTELTTEEIPMIAGEIFPFDELIETATEEEIPPIEGEIVPPDELTEPATEEIPPLAGDIAPADGDVNADGSFGVADVVMFRKWLSAVPDARLGYWQSADFNHDNKLNIFDLLLMKKALIEEKQENLITADDIIELSKKGENLTVADFSAYKGEDIGSGLCVMKYEIADNDNVYLLVGSDGSGDKPIYACLVASDGEEIDIRSDEFQEMLSHIVLFNDAEDNEENRNSARIIGQYALAKLKDGTYTLDTEIDSNNASELLDKETAVLFDEKVFTYLKFADEHTAVLTLNAGLLNVSGYLITDDAVTYQPDTQVSVPDSGYDGDAVSIKWADGNLYYFSAGL